MSEKLMLANTILSMEGSFNISDIQDAFAKIGEQYESVDINDTLETYVECGLINENGFDYEIATLKFA